MPNEVETKVEETTTPQEEINTESTEQQKTTEQQTDSKDTTYKVDLERLREEKKRVERELSDKKFKLRELRDKQESAQQEEITERESFNRDDIQEMLKTEIQNVRRTVAAEQARSIATDISTSTEERDLIMWHFENSIVPSGNVREDIESAQLLANKRKFLAEREEVMRSLQSKENTSNDSASSSRQTNTPGQEPQLSGKDKQMLASAKMNWSAKNNRWEGANTWLKLVNDKWESGRIEK